MVIIPHPEAMAARFVPEPVAWGDLNLTPQKQMSYFILSHTRAISTRMTTTATRITIWMASSTVDSPEIVIAASHSALPGKQPWQSYSPQYISSLSAAGVLIEVHFLFVPG